MQNKYVSNSCEMVNNLICKWQHIEKRRIKRSHLFEFIKKIFCFGYKATADKAVTSGNPSIDFQANFTTSQLGSVTSVSSKIQIC